MSEQSPRSMPSPRDDDGQPRAGPSPASPIRAHPPRIAALVARLRATAVALPGSTQAFELRRRDRQRAGSVLAAGLGARIFLMLLPLAFIASALIGFLDQSNPNFSTRTVHAAGLTANLVKVISQSSADARRGRWILLALGMVLLFYAAHGLYRALYMTHLVAWGMQSSEVHAGSLVLASALLVLLPFIGALTSLTRQAHLGLLLLVALPACAALYSALWLCISCLLPNRAGRWTGLLPGALAWGAGVLMLQFVTVFVLPDRVGGMSQLYGSLATASSTMAWLFLLGRLTVGAATLNAVLWDRSQLGHKA